MKHITLIIIVFSVLLQSGAALAGEEKQEKDVPLGWLDKPPKNAVVVVALKQGFMVAGKLLPRAEFLKFALMDQAKSYPLENAEKRISALSVVIKPEQGVQWSRTQETIGACAMNGIYRIYIKTGPKTTRRIFLPLESGLHPAGSHVPGAVDVTLHADNPGMLTFADKYGKNRIALDDFSKEWNKFDGRYEGVIHSPATVKANQIFEIIKTMKAAGCERIYYSPKTPTVRVRLLREQEYDPELERAIFKTPKILKEKMVEKPIILLEEDVEVTEGPVADNGPRFQDKKPDPDEDPDGEIKPMPDGLGLGADGIPECVPKSMRCRWKKKPMLAREGGSQAVENSINAGLDWLARHQDESDGKWDTDDFQKNCKGPGAPCSHLYSTAPAGNFDAGVSGLALLAFLANGQTHRSGKYRKEIRRGLKYLISVQDGKTGRIGSTTGESWIYNHVLATYALCEAYALTGDNIFKGPAQKAVDYIIQSQNPGYGWKYEPRDGKNDTSVTGWIVATLTAAKDAKIVVPATAFSGALAWFDRVTRVSDGKVGYMRPGDNGAKLYGRPPDTYKSMPTMTAVALLARIHCGQKTDVKQVTQGVKLLMSNLPDYNKPKNDEVNFYYWFHGTSAMFQVGGDDWRKWNKAMKKALIDTQRKGKICQGGSWDPTGEWSIVGGRVSTTALAVLTLQTYYRYARVSKNENKPDEEK